MTASPFKTDIFTNKEKQLRGVIRFAERAEKAYRSVGDTKNAEQAKAHRERIEQELKSLEAS